MLFRCVCYSYLNTLFHSRSRQTLREQRCERHGYFESLTAAFKQRKTFYTHNKYKVQESCLFFLALIYCIDILTFFLFIFLFFGKMFVIGILFKGS